MGFGRPMRGGAVVDQTTPNSLCSSLTGACKREAGVGVGRLRGEEGAQSCSEAGGLKVSRMGCFLGCRQRPRGTGRFKGPQIRF